MAPKRKRAPGGGRKSTGEFSQLKSPLSIRMPDEMRRELEAAAKVNKRSVTQEVLRRVQGSFRQDRDRTHDPAMQALCLLIAKLSSDVIGQWDSDGRPLHNWRSDRFFFRSFKLAVAHVLDALEPVGEMRPPPVVEAEKNNSSEINSESVNSFNTPEERGKYAAKMRWNMLLHADPDLDLDWLDAIPDVADLKADIKNESYGMAKVRRHLQIKFQGGKG